MGEGVAGSERFPRMAPVRRRIGAMAKVDPDRAIEEGFARLAPRISRGSRIAIGVGSRGISRLTDVVKSVVRQLKALGAEPFLLPAMGSHGGATAEGQTGVLASYGITEASVGVPVRAAMEVREIGVSEEVIPVFCSVEALSADGLFLINRIKPHTDFGGSLGSGILKMLVIGLGKHRGAATMHRAASRIGYERAIRGMSRVLLEKTSFLGGVALLENQVHALHKVVVLTREELPDAENALQAEARALMPRLPMEDIDLLIVDFIGKNISGAGMDPNIMGRPVHGYLSSLISEGQARPFVRRIFVRDLSPETHGNAVGLGLADFTTSRAVRAMDARTTYINGLTALTPQAVKVPIHFDTDRECLENALASLALDRSHDARIIRIRDTLSLMSFEASEACREALQEGSEYEVGEWGPMRFGPDGNLEPLAD